MFHHQLSLSLSHFSIFSSPKSVSTIYSSETFSHLLFSDPELASSGAGNAEEVAAAAE
jgi:hypothetical protein